MRKRSDLISPMIVAVAILFIAAATTAAAEASIDARVYKDKKGNTMPYRILKPANYNPMKKYPLVLCLHGAGGRGNDNKSRGTEAFTALSTTEVQEKYPAFLITPQCPANKQWVKTPWKNGSYSISKIPISEELKLAVEILDLVEKEFSIDSSRIYVTGQSMGGYGTWDIILRYPKRFAAAVPVCGAGDPTQAKSIAHIHIWAFHGDRDKTVPTKGTKEMTEALKQAGSKAKYTEYEGVGHNSWSRAWKEENLTTWLFKQHNNPASRAKLNPNRWNKAQTFEIRYCYPVGAREPKCSSHLCRACSGVDVKKVPPDQSAACGSVEMSTGKPGNGSLKLDGSRLQALY